MDETGTQEHSYANFYNHYYHYDYCYYYHCLLLTFFWGTLYLEHIHWEKINFGKIQLRTLNVGKNHKKNNSRKTHHENVPLENTHCRAKVKKKLREQSKTDEVEEKRSFSPKFETRVQKIKADPQIIQNLIQDNKSCRINSST